MSPGQIEIEIEKSGSYVSWVYWNWNWKVGQLCLLGKLKLKLKNWAVMTPGQIEIEIKKLGSYVSWGAYWKGGGEVMDFSDIESMEDVLMELMEMIFAQANQDQDSQNYKP